MLERILETERLLLRPLCMEDAQEAFECWGSDPEVSKYMLWDAQKSVKETEEWIAFELEQLQNEEWYRFAIVQKESNALIGTGLLYYEEEVSCWEIAYNIGKPFWGNGYVTEAMQEILHFAKNKLNLQEIVGRYAKENPASGAILKKLGFRYEKDIPYECDLGAAPRDGILCRWRNSDV